MEGIGNSGRVGDQTPTEFQRGEGLNGQWECTWYSWKFRGVGLFLCSKNVKSVEVGGLMWNSLWYFLKLHNVDWPLPFIPSDLDHALHVTLATLLTMTCNHPTLPRDSTHTPSDLASYTDTLRAYQISSHTGRSEYVVSIKIRGSPQRRLWAVLQDQEKKMMKYIFYLWRWIIICLQSRRNDTSLQTSTHNNHQM